MADVDYGNIDHSGLDFTSANMVLDKATLGGGKFITLNFGFSKGNKDTPVYMKRAGILGYSQSVYYASQEIHVVLHDTEDRRAWLLDGASALLHLALTKLDNEPFNSSILFNRHAFTYVDSLLEPGRAAVSVLTDPNNMALAIQEEVKSRGWETTKSIQPNLDVQIEEKIFTEK